MFNRLVRSVFTLALFALHPWAVDAKSMGWNADALVVELDAKQKIAPPPAGVTELTFSELYLTPVGERGLELSAKVRQLEGKRVRILGFMVKQTQPAMGMAMIAPFALSTHEGEYGLCDDLPAATVFVEVRKFRGIAVPYTPGPLLLTGVLELGRREEADGRVSHVRLILDAETPAPARLPAAGAPLSAR